MTASDRAFAQLGSWSLRHRAPNVPRENVRPRENDRLGFSEILTVESHPKAEMDELDSGWMNYDEFMLNSTSSRVAIDLFSIAQLASRELGRCGTMPDDGPVGRAEGAIPKGCARRRSRALRRGAYDYGREREGAGRAGERRGGDPKPCISYCISNITTVATLQNGPHGSCHTVALSIYTSTSN